MSAVSAAAPCPGCGRAWDEGAGFCEACGSPAASRAGDAPGPEAKPLAGLIKFVRDHVTVANAVILMATSIVGAIDFVVPKVPEVGRVVYTGTAVLAAVMLLAGVAPTWAAKLFSNAPVSSTNALWRRPAWQCILLLLVVVTIVGSGSVAKAREGGWMGSHFPAIRDLQASLLSLQRDMGALQAGVQQANDKLDRVVASIDPANAADACGDLGCALQGGASSKIVRRLFERGARVTGNRINDGELLRMALVNRGEGRFETIDLLFQHGIPRETQLMGNFFSPGEVSRAGIAWARAIDETAQLARLSGPQFDATGNEDLKVWNRATGCLFVTSGGVTALELAALLGDQDMVAHLRAGGSTLPQRPLACQRKTFQGTGFARVVFDPTTTRVTAVLAR